MTCSFFNLNLTTMPEPPEVSFVIPAYNEAKKLPLTLQCLHNAAHANHPFTYEVIVCDNHSSDQTCDIAESLGATVVHEPHQQISRARNTGARAATGRWLIFLDADTLINQRLLDSVLTKIRSNHYGLLGSVVRFSLNDLDYFPMAVVSTWNLISLITGCAAGSFLACPRQAHQLTGGFHQAYYAGEELEFSWRLLRWCRQRNLMAAVEAQAGVITSSRKIRGKSTWDMVRQLRILQPGALKSKAACDFWYDDKWRE